MNNKALLIGGIIVVCILVLATGGTIWYASREPADESTGTTIELDAQNKAVIDTAVKATDKRAALVALEAQIALVESKPAKTDDEKAKKQYTLKMLNDTHVRIKAEAEAAEAKAAATVAARSYAADAERYSNAAVQASVDAKVASDGCAQFTGTDAQLTALIAACRRSATASKSDADAASLELTKANAAVTAGDVASAQLAAGRAQTFAASAAANADAAEAKFLDASARFGEITKSSEADAVLLANAKASAEAASAKANTAQLSASDSYTFAIDYKMHSDSQVAGFAASIEADTTAATAASDTAIASANSAQVAINAKNVAQAQQHVQRANDQANVAQAKAEVAAANVVKLKQRLVDISTANDAAINQRLTASLAASKAAMQVSAETGDLARSSIQTVTGHRDARSPPVQEVVFILNRLNDFKANLDISTNTMINLHDQNAAAVQSRNVVAAEAASNDMTRIAGEQRTSQDNYRSLTTQSASALAAAGGPSNGGGGTGGGTNVPTNKFPNAVKFDMAAKPGLQIRPDGGIDFGNPHILSDDCASGTRCQYKLTPSQFGTDTYYIATVEKPNIMLRVDEAKVDERLEMGACNTTSDDKLCQWMVKANGDGYNITSRADSKLAIRGDGTVKGKRVKLGTLSTSDRQATWMFK